MQIVDARKWAGIPCLLRDPWRFLEDAAELLDEGGTVHAVDRAPIRLGREGGYRGEHAKDNACGERASGVPVTGGHITGGHESMSFHQWITQRDVGNGKVSTSPICRIAPGRDEKRNVIVLVGVEDREVQWHLVEKRRVRELHADPGEILADMEDELVMPDNHFRAREDLCLIRLSAMRWTNAMLRGP